MIVRMIIYHIIRMVITTGRKVLELLRMMRMMCFNIKVYRYKYNNTINKHIYILFFYLYRNELKTSSARPHHPQSYIGVGVMRADDVF